MPEMPGNPAAAAAPAPAPAPAPGGEISLEGMSASELLMLSSTALAIVSQKVVDEYAGQGDLAARLQGLAEEAAGAAAQAMQEIQKAQAGAAGAPGAESGAAPPAPPEAPAG